MEIKNLCQKFKNNVHYIIATDFSLWFTKKSLKTRANGYLKGKFYKKNLLLDIRRWNRRMEKTHNNKLQTQFQKPDWAIYFDMVKKIGKRRPMKVTFVSKRKPDNPWDMWRRIRKPDDSGNRKNKYRHLNETFEIVK